MDDSESALLKRNHTMRDLYTYLRNGGRPFNFERVIRDALSRSEFVARGRAHWLPPAEQPADTAGRTLTQTEEGSLVDTGAAVRASYTWHFDESSAASIRFPDGRAFVDGVDLTKGSCAVSHACEPDTYDGSFTVEDRTMRLTWTVRGPRKDYISTTEFTPSD